MRGTIDRWEGEFAVMELDEGLVRIKRSELPPQTQEGDIVEKQGDCWLLDKKATRQRKNLINKLVKELWEE